MAKGAVLASTRSEDDWQVEADLRCLIECEKIESDPARMKKVRALAKKQMLTFAKVATEGTEAS